MKPAQIGKVFFAKGGHLFPVTPLVDNIPKNFLFSREKKLGKKMAKMGLSKKSSKKQKRNSLAIACRLVLRRFV